MVNDTKVSRKSVLALLKGEKPSTAIVDLGGRVASFSKPAYLDFKKYLGLGAKLSQNETVTLLNTIGDFDEEIFQFVGCPFRRVFLNPPSTFNLRVLKDGSFRDEWGVKYVPRGHFNERIGHPLRDVVSIAELESFPWPDSKNSQRTRGIKEKIVHLKKDPEIMIAAGHVSAGIFQDCWNLRGMQRFLEDMIVNPKFANALLDKVTDIHIGLMDVFLSAAGNDVDIVETADDLGSQKGMLISPRMYRELIKPYHRKLNLAIRKKTKAKILFHSCGAVMPVIEDLIEIGVDILNPIQPIEGKMDPCILNERFNGRLIFHGGLDVQKLLLYGTTEDVEEHVKKYYAALGPENYIMAPANSIQPGTPPENVIAAYQAAREFIR